MNKSFSDKTNPDDSDFSIEEYIFNNFIDFFSLGICFEVHRSIKFSLFEMKVKNNNHEITQIISCDKNDLNSSNNIDNLCSQNGKPLYDEYNKNCLLFNTCDMKNYQCICISCNRNIAASRFAPHLEKCLGMGRNSSRLATKKIRQSIYIENTNSNDENYNEDMESKYYNENNIMYNDNQNYIASDNSSASFISNSSYKNKNKKFSKRKKKLKENNYTKVNTKMPIKLSSLEDNFYQDNLPQSPHTDMINSSKCFNIHPNSFSNPYMQLSISQDNSPEFSIKHISDIQVGDFVALKMKYILSCLNPLYPINTFLNFANLLELYSQPENISQSYTDMEFINQYNQLSLFSNNWLGIIEKFTMNSISEKLIHLRWIQLVPGQRQNNMIMPHLPQTYWEVTQSKVICNEDGKIFLHNSPDTYIPHTVVDIKAIGALFSFDISKPMPEKLLYLLKYMSLISPLWS